MMVEFKTEPQAPLPTIEKFQIPSFQEWNEDSFYGIGIIFIDIEFGRKYAKIWVTNQIIDEDMNYIYQDRFQCDLKDYHLRIRNHSPIWNVLRKMLIADELLPKNNEEAILILPNELKKYLTNRAFKIQGRNLHTYKNAIPLYVGDLQ